MFNWEDITKMYFEKTIGGFDVGIFSLGQVTVAETFEDRIRPSGSISVGKFLCNPRDSSRLNVDPAVWT